jgi:hypothetical protein
VLAAQVESLQLYQIHIHTCIVCLFSSIENTADTRLQLVWHRIFLSKQAQIPSRLDKGCEFKVTSGRSLLNKGVQRAVNAMGNGQTQAPGQVSQADVHVGLVCCNSQSVSATGFTSVHIGHHLGSSRSNSQGSGQFECSQPATACLTIRSSIQLVTACRFICPPRNSTNETLLAALAAGWNFIESQAKAQRSTPDDALHPVNRPAIILGAVINDLSSRLARLPAALPGAAGCGGRPPHPAHLHRRPGRRCLRLLPPQYSIHQIRRLKRLVQA